jgi:selenide,water dikinase
MSTDLFTLDIECGCAAKIPPDRLLDILAGLDLPGHPNLLVGPETLDDAGVYRIDGERCLVQTVDFFPPVARDPYAYGQIAAANSLSDVYAMGGRPLTALAIVCFPVRELEIQVLKDITRGAVDKLREAETLLLGGHSVVDPQPKYGLAVTGEVMTTQLMDNGRARAGDVLVLTKPLGTGITIMAAKAGIATADQEAAANAVMAALNRTASQIATQMTLKSCTDITGFGLLGHASQMARESNVCFEIGFDAIPQLDKAAEFAGMGLLSGATYSNRKYAGDVVAFAADIELAEQDLLFDPQTSGGLLLACPGEQADELLSRLNESVDTACSIIGHVVEKTDEALIRVTRGGRQ